MVGLSGWFHHAGESSLEKVRTVVGDIHQHLDNLGVSEVNCSPSIYGIYVFGQLSCDVIGCFNSNRWLSRDVIGCLTQTVA